jgi:HPt (histidine-containing phosphotransfer) domain-containing protein
MPPEMPPRIATLREAARRLLQQIDRLADAHEIESDPAAPPQDGAAPPGPPGEANAAAERPQTPGRLGSGRGDAQRECPPAIADGAVRYPPPLPGIDAASAIAALCVTPDIFENILVLFYRNNKNVMGKIRRAYAEKDWRAVKKLAHGIKGSASNIRAMKLSDSAQALESAGGLADVDPSAPEPSEEARERLAADLAQVLDGIVAAAGITAEDPPYGERPDPDAQIDRSRLGDLLCDFIQLLDLAVPEEIRRHQEKIRPHLPPLVMADIEAAVHRYDYDEAQEQIRAIAGDMNISIRASAPGLTAFSR